MEEAVKEIVSKFNEHILNPILLILVVISVILFFWGLMTSLLSGDTIKKEESRSKMLWGIIGLFIVFSAWGFLNLVDITLIKFAEPS